MKSLKYAHCCSCKLTLFGREDLFKYYLPKLSDLRSRLYGLMELQRDTIELAVERRLS